MPFPGVEPGTSGFSDRRCYHLSLKGNRMPSAVEFSIFGARIDGRGKSIATRLIQGNEKTARSCWIGGVALARLPAVPPYRASG
jgi:hypothetical protein